MITSYLLNQLKGTIHHKFCVELVVLFLSFVFATIDL